MTSGDALYWDPYDSRFAADPWPVFRRIREEAPLYRNAASTIAATTIAADTIKQETR